MGTFAINGNDPNAVIDAVNHLLANMGTGGNSSSGGGNVSGNVLTANTTTGQITSGGIVVSYLYRWINVRYANSADGSSGFSTSPTNKQYYGVYNSTAQTPSDIANPANYQWTQATGGFGTTKFLWYATYGGGAIGWFVGTAAPDSSYVQTIDNTAIDLNFVTATSTLPLVVPIIYQRGNVAPSTPTGGTYNFTTLTLTPPAGWATSIPTGNTPCYTSQNQFQAVPAGGSVGPSQAWTTPIITSTYGTNGANGTSGSNGVSTVNYNVFQSANTAPSTPTGGYYNFATTTGTPPSGWNNIPSSANGAPIWATTASLSTTNPTANVAVSSWPAPFQYTGAGGAQGTRGFVPMGYVLTPSNPIGASSVQLAAWFGASRNNVVAPIGMGTPPITDDTACFTDATNSANNVVYTFDGNTNTWTAVKGTVVNGNVFVTGSVNAAAMNANDIYGLTMRGGTVTVGTNSGAGFWLQASTGNAYIGGNTYIGNSTTIGNNLKVGNSTSIGNNLVVGNNADIGNNLIVGSNAGIGNNLVVGSSAVIGNDLAIGNNAYIGGNLTVAGLIQGNGVGGGCQLLNNTVITNTLVLGTISGGTAGTAGTDASPYVISNPTAMTTYISDMYTSINTNIANQPVYIWSTLDTRVSFSGLAAGEVIEVDVFLIRQNNTTMSSTTISSKFYQVAGPGTTADFFPSFNGFVDVAPTVGSYTYGVAFLWGMVTGSATVTSISIGNRNILVQTLKR